jgi:hypothetical protein
MVGVRSAAFSPQRCCSRRVVAGFPRDPSLSLMNFRPASYAVQISWCLGSSGFFMGREAILRTAAQDRAVPVRSYHGNGRRTRESS